MMIAALVPAAAAAPYRMPLGPELVWDILLLGLLVVVAGAIILQRRLFAVVMFSGAYSLLSAALLVVLDAVDVAFTEAAVGAGVSTILMLGAMLLTARQARPAPAGRRLGAVVAVAATGAALLYATRDMPGFGDPESPANAYIGRAYLVRTPIEVGPSNVVTAVLASYRGYDTLGETVVIFTAGLGVMLLLGLRDPGESGRRTPQGRRDKEKPRAVKGAARQRAKVVSAPTASGGRSRAHVPEDDGRALPPPPCGEGARGGGSWGRLERLRENPLRALAARRRLMLRGADHADDPHPPAPSPQGGGGGGSSVSDAASVAKVACGGSDELGRTAA